MKIQSFELKGLSFGYQADQKILNHVDLKIPVGGIFHVTGPSGQGQATLLKVLAFLAEPTEGKILINDIDASDMCFEEFLSWRLEIGYTFESGGLLSNRTLEENLMLPQLYHNVSDPELLKTEIYSIAQKFHFEALLDRRPASVSGGLRKLVTILRPMLLRPSFLVMDEPFSGLDSETAKTLEAMIYDYREKGWIQTICFTSRDDVWPNRMSAKPLWVENGQASLKGIAA